MEKRIMGNGRLSKLLARTVAYIAEGNVLSLKKCLWHGFSRPNKKSPDINPRLLNQTKK